MSKYHELEHNYVYHKKSIKNNENMNTKNVGISSYSKVYFYCTKNDGKHVLLI